MVGVVSILLIFDQSQLVESACMAAGGSTWLLAVVAALLEVKY